MTGKIVLGGTGQRRRSDETAPSASCRALREARRRARHAACPARPGQPKDRERVTILRPSDSLIVLIAVMVRLEGAGQGKPEIFRLRACELGELHPNLVEMEGRDFFIEVLWQSIDFAIILALLGPKLDLRQASDW